MIASEWPAYDNKIDIYHRVKSHFSIYLTYHHDFYILNLFFLIFIIMALPRASSKNLYHSEKKDKHKVRTFSLV